MADNCLIDGFIISDAGEYCVYSSGVDFSLVQCTIEDSWQYGIRANDGNVDLSWCTVRNNLYHGILHSGAGYELNIDNCWFMKQKRIGINCEYSTPILKNSIVTESDLNETGNAGIFMLNPSSQPILQNCTISHNKSVGVSLVGNRMPSLINSIVYHNNGGGRQLSANLNPDVVAQYCCIADCNNVNNNINADPEFAYFDPNNVRIMSSSPCHDSGLTLSENYTQFDMDNRDRVLGTVVDRGAYEIECEDVANIYDWNADGLVNLVEFARFSRVWLAHDPNDPALNDPNHVDYEYLTDPNSPSYVTPSNIAAWYPDGHTFNFATVGASQHTIDIADLIFFLEDAPWLWRACWLTDGLLSEQSVAGGGTSVMLTDTKTMSLEAQVIEDKSAIEQAVDLVSIITQLEQLWKDEPDIQQEINAEDWNRFMESVYKSLSELEIDAAEAK
jgi:parallel beta-helix repeat protein